MNPYIEKSYFEKKEFTETQKLIQKEFLILYRSKHYDRISVKELCAQVPIARTTFYSYYQNVDELLKDMEEEQIRKLVDLNDGFMEKKELSHTNVLPFHKTLEFIQKENLIYEAFLIIHPNYRFINKWKNAIKYHFWNRYFKSGCDPNYSLMLEVIASAAISAYTFWLANPTNVNVEQFNGMIIQMIQSIDSAF